MYKILHIPTATYLYVDTDSSKSAPQLSFREYIGTNKEDTLHLLKEFVEYWPMTRLWVYEQILIYSESVDWHKRCMEMKYSIAEFEIIKVK